jgi:hypothetical protein
MSGDARDPERLRDRNRGQLVLVAALALVVALVPLVFAYLQLGYQDDFRSEQSVDTAQVERTLDRSLHAAVASTDGQYSWSRRGAAVTAVRTQLNGTIADLERSQLSEAIVYKVSYNTTRADRWARQNCPSGPNRRFGSCEADRGIVVQQRQGQTQILAVAVDVRATAETTESRLRTVLVVRTA